MKEHVRGRKGIIVEQVFTFLFSPLCNIWFYPVFLSYGWVAGDLLMCPLPTRSDVFILTSILCLFLLINRQPEEPPYCA
jgi:hypothetical protein